MIFLPVMVVIPCLEISVSSGSESVPIKRADAPSDIAVSDMVKGGEPGNSIVPAIEMPFESGRILWPFRVFICPGLHGCCPGRVMGIEFVPIIKFNGPSDIEVPCIVSEDAPGVKVVPAIEIAFESVWKLWAFSVVTWPATKGKGGRAYATELGPTMKAFGPRKIGVPATVIGGAPGVRIALQAKKH